MNATKNRCAQAIVITSDVHPITPPLHHSITPEPITPALHHSITPFPAPVRLFASAKSWIEGEAVRQLYATSRLEGVRQAVGFPDLHPGRGVPVGAAFLMAEKFYPHVIGGDIGCGMGLWKTDLLRRKAKLDRWAALRFDLEHPWEGDTREVLAAAGLHSNRFDAALGTIGGGNHFAELQAIEEILDARNMKQLGLGKDEMVVLVHSGSRGLGETVLRNHMDERHAEGAVAGSCAADDYLRGHDIAVRWAATNRALIAKRFLSAIGATSERVWDACHNSITPLPSPNDEALWLHRKGAVPADKGPLVIPGSRGALSYLALPLGDGEANLWSLAHGAGRKWCRSETRSRMRERFRQPELVQTPLGGRVICEDRALLYEEAPAAYKNIETVIQELVDAGLASVIATLRPLLTYKTRAARR
jgi:release factor H-coupled RctB family protein